MFKKFKAQGESKKHFIILGMNSVIVLFSVMTRAAEIKCYQGFQIASWRKARKTPGMQQEF